MSDGIDLFILSKAIELEGEYFTDMTMQEYPDIVQALDACGDMGRLSIESASFKMATLPEGTGGQYDVLNKTITLAVGNSLRLTTLAHEMIHFYESALSEINPALSEYLLVRLWDKVGASVPDLDKRARKFLELEGHRSLEESGGRHGLLFLLKSFDIDLQLEVPLGTTFDYGMAEEA